MDGTLSTHWQNWITYKFVIRKAEENKKYGRPNTEMSLQIIGCSGRIYREVMKLKLQSPSLLLAPSNALAGSPEMP